MSLLGELQRDAKASLRKALDRRESAGPIEADRLVGIIAERRKHLRTLLLIRRAIRLGHDIENTRGLRTRINQAQEASGSK